MLSIDRPQDEVLSILRAHIKAIPALSRLEREEPCACLHLDLDLEGNFGQSWLFLTEDTLLCLYFVSQKELSLETSRLAYYALEEISEITVDSFVSSNRIVAALNSGRSVSVGFCTNSGKQRLFAFLYVTEQKKDKKEVAEDDPVLEQLNVCCPKCGIPYPDAKSKVCPNCVNKSAVYKRLLRYFIPYKKEVAVIGVCLVLTCILALLNPYLGGAFLYGRVLNPAEANPMIKGNVWLGVGIILATAVVTLAINIVRSRANASLSSNVTLNMKLDIFSAMQRLSLSYFNSNQTGRLITRVDYDASIVRGFFTDSLPALFINIVTFAVAALMMFLIDWKLSLIVFVPVPFILIIFKTMFPKLWKSYTRRWRQSSTLNAVLADSLSGVRVVKAFAKEHEETHRFAMFSDKLLRADLKLNAIHLCIFPVVGILISLSSQMIWGFGGIKVMERTMDYGLFLTFIQYTVMIFNPLQFFTNVSDALTNTANSAQRMFEVLDAIPEITEKDGAAALDDMKGKIELRNVSFSYQPNRPILKHVSLTVEAGTDIGLVGRTGAGKSTIANLITRLYDVNSGQIFIDDVDIKNIKIQTLRKKIAIVSQEIFLFRGTVADNIRYARPDASDQEVIEAARAANAHDFILHLPNGYETIVGTGSRSLSGGEQQRVSIARALLLNPKILILDEATAAMDTETERLIQAALQNLAQGRTTITIAHRLSTLKDCSAIYSLDNGEVAESGSHDELIAKKGIYYKLYTLQSEAMKKVIAGD